MNISLFQKCNKASEYNLPHIVEHLIRAGHFNKLWNLIIPEFMWAKRIKYGSHQNFIKDIEQTIGVSRDEGLDGLTHLIFYSMLYATLRSMATNVTPEVLRILSVLGQMERAVDYAEIISDPYQKALAFQILGGGGEKAKKKKETEGVQRKLNRELMHRAFSESIRIENGYDKTQFLSTLAPDLARTGDMEAALYCVQQISEEEPYDLRGRTLAKVSVELALAGRKNEAFQVYEQLEEGYAKTNLRKDLVMALAKAGLIKDALNAAITVNEKEDIVQSIARIWSVKRNWLHDAVNTAKEIQDIEERTRVISETASVIDAYQQDIIERKAKTNPFEIAKAAKEIALTLIWLGRYDDALDVLRTIDTNDFNIYFSVSPAIEYEFGVFVKGLLMLGRLEDVEYLIENRWVDSYVLDRFPIWKDLCFNLQNLTKQGNLDEVFNAIEKIEPKEHQADAMLLVGPQLARLGRIQDIIDFYEDNRDDGHFDATAHELATHLANQGMFMEAELFEGIS